MKKNFLKDFYKLYIIAQMMIFFFFSYWYRTSNNFIVFLVFINFSMCIYLFISKVYIIKINDIIIALFMLLIYIYHYFTADHFCSIELMILYLFLTYVIIFKILLQIGYMSFINSNIKIFGIIIGLYGILEWFLKKNLIYDNIFGKYAFVSDIYNIRASFAEPLITSFVFCIFTFIIMNRNNRKENLITYCFIIIALSICILTQKRTGMVFLVIGIILSEIFPVIINKQEKFTKKHFYKWGSLGIVFLIAIFTIRINGLTIFELVIDRFMALSKSNPSGHYSVTHRFNSIILSMNHYFNGNILEILMGNGYRSLYYYFSTNNITISMKGFYVVDNTYISLINDFGLFSLIIFIFTSIKLFVRNCVNLRVTKSKENIKLYTSSILSLLFMMLFIFFFDSYSWFPGVFIIAFVIALAEYTSTIEKDKKVKMREINIKKILKKTPIIKTVIKKIKKEGRIEKYEIKEIKQIVPCQTDEKSYRFNLLITSMNQNDVFAGIKTAVDFFYNLAQKKQAKMRIIVMDIPVDESNIFKIDNYIKLAKSKQDYNNDKVIIDMTNRLDKVPVGINDIFIATMWHTAYSISDLLEWQKNTYNKSSNLIYMIQDYEPGFYPWSSRYLLAQSTYKMDIKTIAVFNSYSLNEFLNKEGFSFYSEYAFAPKLDQELKNYLLKNKDKYKRKNRILIYGRPHKSRNAFEVIAMSLNEWYKHDTSASEWEVYSAGQEFENIKCESGLVIKSVGKLSIEEYARMMLETKVGISLMVSPHPSYPPLEMSTFGIKVITNSFANKDLQTFNNNILSISNCSIKNIADTISKLTSDKELKNIPILDKDYLEENNDQWDEIYQGIFKDLGIEGEN